MILLALALDDWRHSSWLAGRFRFEPEATTMPPAAESTPLTGRVNVFLGRTVPCPAENGSAMRHPGTGPPGREPGTYRP